MQIRRECKQCGAEFILLSDHYGFATLCRECNQSTIEVERVEAEVSWLNKHTPLINITDAKSARAFNRKQRRYGASVTANLVQSQTGPGETLPNDANPGSEYRSPLNEKHSLKR